MKHYAVGRQVIAFLSEILCIRIGGHFSHIMCHHNRIVGMLL